MLLLDAFPKVASNWHYKKRLRLASRLTRLRNPRRLNEAIPVMDSATATIRIARLDASKPTPLYIQLQRAIEDAIAAGRLSADEALVSERDLAKQLGISRVTVRKALSGLVERGMLVQRWGSGTFVAPPMHVEQPLSRLSSFTNDMMARGLQPGARVIARSMGPASPDESMALGLSPGETVSRLQRLRLAADVPMALEHAVVPAKFLPDPHLVEGSLYAALSARGHVPVRALQRLHAVVLRDDQAELLAISRGSPALYIERRSFLEGGAAVEFTASYYRGDAYDFVAELSLRPPTA